MLRNTSCVGLAPFFSDPQLISVSLFPELGGE